MNSGKQAEIEEAIRFLSPRLRELLRRVSKKDRRSPLDQLAFYIEEDANGRLKYYRDEPLNPRVPLDSLPEVQLVEQVRVRRELRPTVEIDSPPPAGDTGE